MKGMLHEIWAAPTKNDANQAFEFFEATFAAKCPSAVDCLTKDCDSLMAFFDFPEESWCHIRPSNPIESTFATVRLRHRKTKGNGSAKASLVMIFELAESASKGWRKLRGHHHIPELLLGVKFIDGISEHQLNEATSQLSETNSIQTETVA